MKTKTRTDKDFDTVKTFREIKEKISKEIQGKSFEDFKAYLAERKLKPKSAS